MSHQAPVQLPRGRPRSFDVEAAVERAMAVFWTRGYHATALPDLLRATRLSRGSLYAAFGDKHSLFLRALDRYIADALTRMDIEFDSRSEPVDGLRTWLAGYVDRTTGAKGRRGCLLVATAMELAGEDAEVGRRVASFFKAMEDGGQVGRWRRAFECRPNSRLFRRGAARRRQNGAAADHVASHR
jgi:TetR/AcrR family transcriptional regulator, transcriptional repressor for nem operon